MARICDVIVGCGRSSRSLQTSRYSSSTRAAVHPCCCSVSLLNLSAASISNRASLCAVLLGAVVFDIGYTTRISGTIKCARLSTPRSPSLIPGVAPPGCPPGPRSREMDSMSRVNEKNGRGAVAGRLRIPLRSPDMSAGRAVVQGGPRVVTHRAGRQPPHMTSLLVI